MALGLSLTAVRPYGGAEPVFRLLDALMAIIRVVYAPMVRHHSYLQM
jgi:hypothetical protein